MFHIVGDGRDFGNLYGTDWLSLAQARSPLNLKDQQPMADALG